MFWADKLAKQIIASGKHQPYWVDDMKTPSGRIHVGSLLGVLLHDFVYKSLIDQGVKVKYTYVINDMDPMDGLPIYIDQDKYQKFMGFPLYKIPAPDGITKSYGHQFAHEFIETMQKLGAFPEILYSHELYELGKMNGVIKEALNKVETVRHVYQKVAGYKKPENWYPFQVICPKCGKVGTTQVFGWDGEKVKFCCEPHLVKWAIGCGYEGEISPFNGTGKLMWKVDWPAHWKVIGVTIEGAGKDHCSAGGSRDMAKSLLKEVFDYPSPFDIPYEFFLIGGRKMSSSKGRGVAAADFAEILPPQLGRFLFARNNYNQQNNFNPEGMTIPDLFDEYDRCARVYWEKGNKDDFGRIYEVAQIISQKSILREYSGQEVKSQKLEVEDWKIKKFLPRFLEVAKVIQDPKLELESYFTKQKSSTLTKIEKDVLSERKIYAEKWLQNYAPENFVIRVQKNLDEDALKILSKEQRKLLLELAEYLEKKQKEIKEEELQNDIYQSGKKLGLKPKETFQAVYLALLGKTAGPKAGALILEQDIDWVIRRFKEAGREEKVSSNTK